MEDQVDYDIEKVIFLAYSPGPIVAKNDSWEIRVNYTYYIPLENLGCQASENVWFHL